MNKIKKLLIILSMVLLFCGLVYSIIGTVNTFVGETDPFIVTFENTTPQNITKYIDIPIYSDVKNFTIELVGLTA